MDGSHYGLTSDDSLYYRYNSTMRRTTPRRSRDPCWPLFAHLDQPTQRPMVWILRGRPMLSGSDLLAKVKELGDISKSDLVRSCGYVSTKKDGTERLNFTAFYEALLNAKDAAGLAWDAAPKF